jgi:hypothetical protein
LDFWEWGRGKLTFKFNLNSLLHYLILSYWFPIPGGKDEGLLYVCAGHYETPDRFP